MSKRINIVISTASPDRTIAIAVETAREQSEAILDLVEKPLRDDETMNERVKQIARHGVKLAEAFAVIDSIASNNDSPADSPDGALGSQGCATREVDPNAN